MSSIAQRKHLYFPRWNAAFKANWRADRGRILALPGRAGSEWLTAVETASHQLALTDHCASTADHLRHACTIVAIGRKKSSKELTNAELDRVLALFDLLIDPDNLQAVVAWQHPEIAERQKKIAAILELRPLAYAREVASHIFHCADLEKLSVSQLEGLRQKFWTQAHKAPRSNKERELDPANSPF